MSNKIESNITLRILIGVLTAVGLVIGTTSVSQADSGDDVRTTVSTHIVNGGRENGADGKDSVDDYTALKTTGTRDSAKTRAGNAKPGTGSTRSESTGFDFWFYDVDVQLFNDDDLDGYYHGIDVLFDIDTNFLVADVYAVLYLSYEGGPWNEYAVTEDFTLLDTSSTDEYVLVSELMSGYPTGDYDLLIEVFDSFDGAFLASFGPEDSSAVSFLPLEDFNRDAPVSEVQVVVSQGGGGSVNLWMMGLLTLVLWSMARRFNRRRTEALLRIKSPTTAWRNH